MIDSTISKNAPDSIQFQSGAKAPGRDDRIDLFRGLALMVIFIDHVEILNGMSVISRYTLRSLGLCDATEVFVFISGYVCGISYWHVLTQSGFYACQMKALIRVRQLWIANLVTLSLVLNLVFLCQDLGNFEFASYRLGGLSDPLVQQIPRIIFQIYQPALFDVLTLYMLLLLVLPLYLSAASTRPILTWVVVLGIYSAVQFFPWFNYPIYDFNSSQLSGTVRTFNNFAWQLLFFIGCALGVRRLHGKRNTVRGMGAILSGAVVIAVALGRVPALSASHGEAIRVLKESVQVIVWSPLARKLTEGPIRIVYFLSFAAVTDFVVPRRIGPVAGWLTRPFVHCGQNPLIVFCIGLFLSYAVHPILKLSPQSTILILIFEIFGCGAMMWAGTVLSRRRNARQRGEYASSQLGFER